MATTWDWGPVAQGLQGLIGNYVQQKQYNNLLQNLLGGGVQTPQPQPGQGLIARLLHPQPLSTQAPTASAPPVQMSPQAMIDNQMLGGDQPVGSLPSIQNATPRDDFLRQMIGRLFPSAASAQAGGQQQGGVGQSPAGAPSLVNPQLAQLFRSLPPQIGMPLLLQTIQSQMTPQKPEDVGPGHRLVDPRTGREIYSAPESADYGDKSFGLNPNTGKPDTWIIDKKSGQTKWLGIAPPPSIEFVNGQAVDKNTGKPLPLPPIPKEPDLPAGYTAGPNGSLNYIPGGPADPKKISEDATTRRMVEVNNPLPPQQTALSPEAIDNAAAFYMETGRYPGTMRDRASVAAVQNRIAELKPKDIPSSQWMSGMANNAIAYHAKQIAAAQTGKQQALTTVNEDTVNGSIGILDGLLKKGAASKLPFTTANEALQWMARNTNDPDAANLKNAIGAISNEYARVMTGQTGGAAASDSARNEAATRLLLGFKEGTMRAVAGQMQREMKVRSDAYIHAMNQLTGGQYGGASPAPVTPIDQPQAPGPNTGGAPMQGGGNAPLTAKGPNGQRIQWNGSAWVPVQ